MASRPIVAPYAPDDHEGVVALWRAVFPDAPARNDPVLDIRRKLDVQPELFLVARVGRGVVGTTMAGFDGHRGWLHLVAVDPERRREGIGAGLLREAERRLAALGCPKLNLQVRASSPEVVRFYERLGYAVEPRISMGKVLAAGEAIEDPRLPNTSP
ncbi:MAG: GNAT family acetyltransferase [Myxococcota bacterium]